VSFTLLYSDISRQGFPKVLYHFHVLVGVLAEDVPDDNNGLLDHIVDLGLDEV